MINKRCPRGSTIIEGLNFHSTVATNGCIEWSGYVDKKGYGRFTVKNRTYRVHRLVWEQKIGKIPEGLSVLHKCDNRKCFNVDHLFIGTHKDNMLDMVSKGRQAINTVPRKQKLNSDQIMSLMDDFKSGLLQYLIAKKYKVSESTISRIVNNN